MRTPGGMLIEDRGSQLFVPNAGLLIPGFGVLLPGTDEPEELFDRLGRKVKPIAGGAFGTSGMYLLNFIDAWDATQLALDLSLTTHKFALYTNTLTPNFSSDVSYAATNEITGTNYAAGGRTIAAGGGSPTLTESPTGTIMYDMNDMTWPTATFTARGSIEYADALGSDNLIVAHTFGADITATAGTFTIQWNSLGVATWDITP
jgi:hypothetical protein